MLIDYLEKVLQDVSQVLFLYSYVGYVPSHVFSFLSMAKKKSLYIHS